MATLPLKGLLVTREEACGKTPRILKSGEQGPENLSGNVEDTSGRKGLSGNSGQSQEKRRSLLCGRKHLPVRHTNGEITHFISNGRDLTERLRLEAQLVQAQKADAVGRLAGGIAHNFNNLLTIIPSYSELALDAAPKDSPLEDKLHEILLAAGRAAELTRRLLAFSRKQPQALQVVEVNQVAQHRQDVAQADRRRHRVYVRAGRTPGQSQARSSTTRTGTNESGGECARCHAGRQSPANRNVSGFF